MEDGKQIAYAVLEKGVPVVCSGGERVGTVDHVVAAPEEDIFHGLVVATPQGHRFVEAAVVASLREHLVELRIDAEEAAGLPQPGGGAPEYEGDPAAVNSLSHWVNRLTLRKDWRRRR